MDAYSYTGSAGQVLSFALWSSLGAGEEQGDPMVADIYSPGGQLLTSAVAHGYYLGGGAYSGGGAVNLTLTNSGTYTILVHNYYYTYTSSYGLSVQSVTGGGCDSRGISCGQTLASATTNNSEMDAYSYTGSAGQVLSFALWSSLGAGEEQGDPMVADIYSPGGQLLTSAVANAYYLGGGAYQGGGAVNLTLTNSGTYTILVHNVYYTYISSYAFSVQSVNSGGCNGDSIFCGETVNGQITQGSQIIGYELVANATEHVIFSDSGFSGMVVDMYDPTGSNVVSIGPSASTNYTFADTGIYTVVVHAGNYIGTGAYSLTETVFGGCATLPTVSFSPTNEAVLLGTTATLTPIASGPTPLFYQWWFGTNLISGATNSALSIANLQTNELGLYEVYVNNPGGAVSNTVRLQGIPIITWTNPGPIIYGASLTSNQLNATADVPGNFAYTPTNGTVLNAGTNTLSVIFTPTDTVNYVKVTNTASLVVSNAPLTITATNRSKIYGQTISFSGTEFTTIGLVNGDTVTSASIGSAGAAPTAPVSGSPFAIAITNAMGDAGLSNYIITYDAGHLTVNPADLTVTASAQSKTYGQTVVFGSGSTLFNPSGLQNGETIGTVTLAVSGNGGAPTAPVSGSPYTITPSLATGGTFTPGNYAITYATGNLTVSSAALTVTANAQSKTYGQTVVFSSGSTLFTSSGLQNGETIGTVTLAVSGNGGAPTAPVSGSPYTITPSAATGGTFTPGNYAITYATGNLTVTTAALTVTANAQSKTYGQTVLFGSGSTLFTPSGLQNGETIGTVTLAVSSNGGAATASVAGSPYTITPSAATGGTFTPGNYTITYATGNLTVNKAALTVTANAQSKTYGQTLNLGTTAFTTTVLSNSDNVNSVTLTSPGAAATATVAGSPYTITASAPVGTGLANYGISYVPGSLTVTAAPLTVTANNTNRPYGAANPVFTGTIVGLTNGDNITESFSCNATNTSSAGPYAIIPILIDPNGRLVNYSPITTNNGVLTVTPGIVLTAPSWLGNGQFKLSFNTTVGQNYTVQYSTDLSHWTSLVELGGDGSPLTVTDFSASTTYRYYRVISP
jgi:type II secretory pathway component PulC